MAKCALCKKEAELRRSHVIPEFAYRQLYDKKHRLQLISPDDIPQQYHQKGFRQEMLCDACEALFNRNEAYINRLFEEKTDAVVERQGGLTFYSGLDYTRFRLFFLSILWRAAVTNVDFFKNVRLASNRSERLRKMLLREDPGYPAPDLWPITFGTLIHDGKLLPGFMIAPVQVFLKTHHAYAFIFGGLYWQIHTSSHQQPESILKMTPWPDGDLIAIDTELSEVEFLEPLLEELCKR